MFYKVTLTVECSEPITESEISDRVESLNFDPFIEVHDCHVEEAEGQTSSSADAAVV